MAHNCGTFTAGQGIAIVTLYQASQAMFEVDRAIIGRQDGPTDPNVPEDCTLFDTATSPDQDCSYFESSWGITRAEFVSWNPSVRQDCTGIVVGNSYCVEVNFGIPRPTTTSRAVTTSRTTTSQTGTPRPSPTQAGLVESCAQFYQAAEGDDCSRIVAAHSTFALSDFLAWNPAVGQDCRNLLLGYYYCVGIPGTPTTRTTATTATTSRTPTPTSTGPSPVQSGIAPNCVRYHQAAEGDSCAGLVTRYGTFTLQQFYQWNPAVGNNCGGFWLGYFYCIGIPGTPTSATTRPTPSCPSAPTPTQPGAVCSCKRWHRIAQGNTCDSIVRQYRITANQFHQWNPQVWRACTNLWLGYNVCVGM